MPAVTPGRPAPRVLVTVGTDHHPFDRLITWVNEWLAGHPGQAGEFYVQWGAAATQPACPGSAFLTVDELDALLDTASVVVCHGGPGSIAGAWERGRVPVVVPRLPKLGEIVDGHQVDFCDKLAGLGRVRLAQTPAEFAAALGGALSEPQLPAGDLPTPPGQTCHAAEVQAAVAQFAALVDGLVRQPRRRLPLPRRLVPLPRRLVPRPRGANPPGIETHAGKAAARGASPALIPEQPASWEAARPAASFALSREPSKEQ